MLLDWRSLRDTVTGEACFIAISWVIGGRGGYPQEMGLWYRALVAKEESGLVSAVGLYTLSETREMYGVSRSWKGDNAFFSGCTRGCTMQPCLLRNVSVFYPTAGGY